MYATLGLSQSISTRRSLNIWNRFWLSKMPWKLISMAKGFPMA